MTAHAKKSASGSKRWINCPGSLALIERLAEGMKGGSSTAADLGTCAHALGERCLLEGLTTSRGYKGYTIQYENGMDGEVWYDPGEAPKASGFYPVDDDMCSAVDLYLDTVWAMKAEMGETCEMFVEKRFSLEWLRPDMFGTSDCTLWQFMGLLRAIDYKHGQGVAVEVEDNTQGLYYALGLAHEVDWLFEEIEVVIVQPRCPHSDGSVRKWRITKAELEEFQVYIAAASDRVDEARDALDAVESPGDMEAWEQQYLKTGDHCQFCDKLATCPAAWNTAQTIAMADFADHPHGLEVPEIGEDPADLERLASLLEWAKFLDGFVKAAKNLGQRRLEQGLSVPRHKLVRGKANRVWSVDAETLRARLEAIGVGVEDMYGEPKLKSPAQIEKIGKEAKKLVSGVKAPKNAPEGTPEYLEAPLAFKGAGKISMAHETDPRGAVSYDPTQDFPDTDPDEEADA